MLFNFTLFIDIYIINIFEKLIIFLNIINLDLLLFIIKSSYFIY